MFLLYIYDLQFAFSKSIIHSFADDTNLIFSSKKLGTIESVINNDLKHLVQWLRGNELLLNETKTELIIFRLLWKQLPILNFNCKLKLHTQVKYVGIFIDEVLSWNKQIDILCSKLSRANGILSKLRHFPPLKTCLSVCYSIFYSYLFLAWSYTKEVIFDRVDKLQKRCIRILTFSDFNSHTIDLFAKLKMLKFQDSFHPEQTYIYV